MDDQSIVQLYLERNEDAIKETNLQYGTYCRSIARNILTSFQDIEECIEDTYIHTWNSIPPTIPTSLKLYVGTITRNLSFNLFKKNNAMKRGNGQMELVLDELAEIVSGKQDVEDYLHHSELIEAINAFLASLPAKKRKIFVSRYYYGDSIQDIAIRMQISENQTSVTLNRLRKQLAKELTKRGYEL